MSDRSKIDWCDATWNPITGCSPISPACDHCYAARMAKRLAGRCGYPDKNPFAVTFHEEKLIQPILWKKRRRIFVCSMGDLFHAGIEDEWMCRVIDAMRMAPQHIYMILTKRPDIGGIVYRRFQSIWPAELIDIGVTVENNDYRHRIDEMMKVPAAGYFVSVEPCLGSVDLSGFLRPVICSQCGQAWDAPACGPTHAVLAAGGVIRLVILGGETGPGARPMHPKDVRSVRDQCVRTHTPFMFKGWGEWTPDTYQDWKESEVYTFEDGTEMYKHGRIARKWKLDEYKEIDGVKWPGEIA